MNTKVNIGARYLLGVIYFVFGLNGFLQFLPMPPLPEQAGAFLGGLAASGYFFPFLKGTEVVGGLLLLAGFSVPLALVVLAPITLNIFLFHLFLTPGLSNVVLPLVMIVLNVLAALQYWHIFGRLFGRGQ